jgi:hypothetical protein
MSGHHKNVDDCLVSGAMLNAALTELVKHVNLDREHDIPYLAGYNVDHSKIYIDRHLARTYKDHQGHSHEVDKFLIIHEATEKAMIDNWHLHYQHAHQIALRAEEAAVRAAGLEWREYDGFMQQWIKKADSEKITAVPLTLDLTPYLDENDHELIKVMQRAMVP